MQRSSIIVYHEENNNDLDDGGRTHVQRYRRKDGGQFSQTLFFSAAPSYSHTQRSTGPPIITTAHSILNKGLCSVAETI